MNIRRATQKDIPQLDKLLYQVHRLHAEGRPDIFRLGNKKYTDDELCSILSNQNTPVFVAVDSFDLAMGYAFCVYQTVEGNNSLCDRKTLYIDDLCVDAHCRGQHIGTELYHFVLEEAERNQCAAVTLNVWCLNEGAMKFYQSLGMTPLKVVMEQALDKKES